MGNAPSVISVCVCVFVFRIRRVMPVCFYSNVPSEILSRVTHQHCFHVSLLRLGCLHGRQGVWCQGLYCSHLQSKQACDALCFKISSDLKSHIMCLWIAYNTQVSSHHCARSTRAASAVKIIECDCSVTEPKSHLSPQRSFDDPGKHREKRLPQKQIEMIE